MKPVLVFVFSQKCGACINFKRKVLPELEAALVTNPNINIVVLEFPEMAIPNQDPDVGEYHPDLKNGFVRFFPTIALFPGDIWKDHKGKLKGVIKHGDEDVPKVDYSKNGILKWIDDTLRNHHFFSNTVKTKKYVVPTYGQFYSTKIDETELN